MKIDADMLIIDILETEPALAGVLMQRGMHCVECFAAAGETLREAAYVHGMNDEDVEEIVDQLNDFLSMTSAEA